MVTLYEVFISYSFVFDHWTFLGSIYSHLVHKSVEERNRK